MSSIELYAELLVNIRTVTLFASIISEEHSETSAELAVDRDSVTVSHEGITATLRLPTKVGKGGTIKTKIPPVPRNDFTLRLKVEEKELGLLFDYGERSNENLVPWAAGEMQDALRISCCDCGEALVKCEEVVTWKDLPNENWAEMMDLWHCHKPDDEHSHDPEVGKEKGYAAGNKLFAFPGTGFVDLSSFLFAEDDCTGVEISNEELKQDEPQELLCKSCDAVVGRIDARAEGWRIMKWSCAVRFPSENDEEKDVSFPVEKWFCAHLLSLIENQGTRKFIVESTSLDDPDSPSTSTSDSHSESDSDPASNSDTSSPPDSESDTYSVSSSSPELPPTPLLLWAFTPSLLYSSSTPSPHPSPPRKDPTRAMKIFHQPCADPEGLMQRDALAHELVRLPADVFAQVVQALEDSRTVMPQGARRFREWDVGLLERFGVRDGPWGGGGDEERDGEGDGFDLDFGGGVRLGEGVGALPPEYAELFK